MLSKWKMRKYERRDDLDTNLEKLRSKLLTRKKIKFDGRMRFVGRAKQKSERVLMRIA